MKKYPIIGLIGLSAWIGCTAAIAAPLDLFGVPLLGATRQTLESVAVGPAPRRICNWKMLLYQKMKAEMHQQNQQHQAAQAKAHANAF